MAEVVDSQQDERAQAAREAADAVQSDGTELCARLVFRASRNELRRVGIATPAALYDELKQVFWNADEGVILGDHLESTPIPLTPFTPPSGGLRLWASWPLRTRRG